MIAAATEFQPGSAAELLALCAGEWMCLRSKYVPAGGDEDWQQSERADLQWIWLASTEPDQLGTLQFLTKGEPHQKLQFFSDGKLKTATGDHASWKLRAGQLELSQQIGEQRLEETISFCKPNLRLRNVLLWHGDQLEAAQFCSEIRRVRDSVS